MSAHPVQSTTNAGLVLGGRYTLLTPIAQGGMGEVWKARDSVTGRLVAAKVLRSELAGEELSLSRLRIEARNAMSVQHPNIANVQDSGEEEGRGWIVMELVDGLPLTHYLRGGARIAPADLLPVLMQIAMALGAAAKAGVVHRDIKPANVLIRSDGMVKLTDFGISRAVNQIDLTAAGMVMGTAQYLPPEQAMGEKATCLGDLYALGVIAYEAAAGRRPFTGQTQVDIAFSHVNDPVPPLPADVPGPFGDVILHLLEKDPAKRPDSGLAVVRELSAAAKAMGVGVDPHPLPSPQGASPRAAFPALAPVAHTQRRTLPEDLLQAPAALVDPLDSPATALVPVVARTAPSFPVEAAREAAAEEPAAPSSSGSGSASSESRRPSSADAADPDPAQRRAVLAARLRERALARQEEDARRRADSDASRSGVEREPAAEARPAPTPARQEPAPAAPRRSRSGIRPRPSLASAALPSQSAPWRAVSARSIVPAAGGPAAPTEYNRSQVAPAPAPGLRLARLALVLLIILALLALGGFALHHLLASVSSTIGATTPTLEEVPTWLSPWHAV